MIADRALTEARFRALERPSGRLALLALDQRESLRTMLREAGRPHDDEAVGAFKAEAARVLSRVGSGVLLDTPLGLDAVSAAGAMHPACGLIVAADALTQQPGRPVEATEFDETVDMADHVARGAVAFKLLVLWRRDDKPGPRDAMVRRFVDACESAKALSLVEGVVRPPANLTDWDRDDDALEAAVDLASAGPDIYKAEVPTLGRGPAAEIEDRSRQITGAIATPWVVLSAGVDPEAFLPSVLAACRGGASGFLAGRAVWAPAIRRPGDLGANLATDALDRLDGLAAAADLAGRPWRDALESRPQAAAT